MGIEEIAERQRRIGIDLYKLAAEREDFSLLEESLRRFEQAVTLDSSNSESHLNYGIALARKYTLTLNNEILEQAITHFQIYTTLNPNDQRNCWIYAQMGEAFDRLGRQDDAKEALTKALELNPLLPLTPELRQKYF